MIDLEGARVDDSGVRDGVVVGRDPAGGGKALPGDLAHLDELLSDPGLFAPIATRWERLLAESGSCAGRGRPTIAMERYVRLMVVKHRSGWGYETLMREVSDSLHLRSFCRIGMTDRVPDESTVRKLTRRLGAEVVHEITRELIQKARREKRFGPGRRGSTRPLWKPTCGIRPTRGWRTLVPGACPRGSQARGQDRREAHRGQRSLADDRSQAACVDALDPPPLGGGEGRGAGADRTDRDELPWVSRRPNYEDSNLGEGSSVSWQDDRSIRRS